MAVRLTPSLIGRSDVLNELRRLLYNPPQQGAALILLTGEEGIGKSSLLRTAVRDAREHGFMVLEGRPQAVELPQPFFLLHELLNSLATQREREAAPQEGLKSLVTLGFSRPGGRDRGALPMGLLPFSASLESPEEREERLLAALSGRETNREEEEQELFDKLADHLDEVATEKKLILAIDDLQYADQASMDFLGYLSRRTRGRNMKVVATCRPETEIPETIRSVLNDISREGLLHRLEVKRLTEEESQEFLKHLSRGREIPTATVREWYTTSRGNPLALEQLFRGGMTSGDITREGPARVSAVFAKLSEEDRRILSHASVLGKSFTFHSLYHAVGGDEEKLTEMVDSLIHSGTLKERGDETYEFSNEELWREVYNSMTERRRRILHRKAAEAIEANPNLGPIAAYDLAKHYYLARDYERSVKFNRQAADMAKKSLDYEASSVYLEQALQSLRNLPKRDQKEYEAVVLDIAMCLGVTGEVDRGIKLLQEVATPGILTLHLAILMSDAGRWKEAEKLITETVEKVGESGEPAILGTAHRMLGGMASYRGQFAEAATHMEKAIPFLQKANMLPEAARVKLLLADQKRSANTAKMDEIDADYKSGIEELRSIGNFTLLAPALLNYGLWQVEMDHIDDGLRILEEALTVAEKLHHARHTGWVLFNMADVLFSKGDTRRAEEMNARAKERLEKVGDKLGLIQVHLVNARIMEQKGQDVTAEVEILEAFRLAQEVGFEPDQMEVLFRQGEFFLHKGDKEGARKRLEELELREFEKLRPDLKADFHRFREEVKK
jgi:tetratricopeptide (TPR) repeat protein